ncbi:MAG TPA: preprotein translocase subunit SecA [Gaiellales bacterium]|jgi:preprotein translocase subunit SecA|nr:preprotein translocase subunit SecA [Gaiellales bacterium]
MSMFQKFLRAGEGRTLKRLEQRVREVNALESDIEQLSDDQLAAKTIEFRERFEAGEELEELLPEAFACVREASKRTLGLRHFDVQLVGGMVLHEGRIAEMKTGEGKTLVATLPLYLNSIAGVNVHLVTVNDYLARRDAAWMGPVYQALGISVGVIQSQMPDDERKVAYASDITYGTNSEFGFDYLRDNMAPSLEWTVQRGHWFAIVDEVDSILIDEARTPLIISGEPEAAAETYYAFASAVADLQNEVDYEVDEKFQTAAPTEDGVAKVERALGVDNLYAPENGQLVNHLIQAIKAKELYQRDVEYVISDGEVKIVDEFTGRIMEGRRWSEGLHQAVEAKEGVRIQDENVTVATITIQNYFRMYTKLAGMTGTALTEANEFHEIYGLEVVPVPTNMPMIRRDENDLIYRTKDEKFAAVADDIVERHGTGQPVLVGTISVEVSEHLSRLLERRGIAHEVLNAKNHEREAAIIEKAGEPGAVTIATNMAGRGVDIKLGEGVADRGGLYVLGTERHESRRIDNQLRGRSGRQGDPGETRFYLSAQDEVIRLFAGERIYRILDSKIGPGEGEPIEHSMLTRRIEGAQKKVEEFHFVNRKNVVKYDDVLNEQRSQVYQRRREILDGEDLRESVMGWIEDVIEATVDVHTEGEFAEEWDWDALWTGLHTVYPTRVPLESIDREHVSREQLLDLVFDDAVAYYEEREREWTEMEPSLPRDIERWFTLQVLDVRWREHLDNMDYMRQGIGLRGYAQKDPLVEYKAEGTAMFDEMNGVVKQEIVRMLMHAQIEAAPDTPETAPSEQLSYRHDDATLDASALEALATGDAVGDAPDEGLPVVEQRHVDPEKNIGRNDPCWCGSGKKFKRCHGA